MNLTSYYVVEIHDEDDDLIGYGVCRQTETSTGTKYAMQPDVHGTRSEAHAAVARMSPGVSS